MSDYAFHLGFDPILTLSSSMNVAAGPELAAAVTNAGGLGVIGGIGYTPKVLKQQVRVNVSALLPSRTACTRGMHSTERLTNPLRRLN